MTKTSIFSAAICCVFAISSAWSADQTAIATVPVQTTDSAAADRVSYEGVVEAMRQTVLSAQVPGSIVALNVKTGDLVKAGQELARIDARAANQNTAAAIAQVEATRAAMNVASSEYERQKQLFQKQYISQSALDRAQAQFQAAQAQMQSLQAQANAAQTQSRFFVINAPYAGVISDVQVTLGDMAMPGRPLVVMYDPTALRITAAVPPNSFSVGDATGSIQYEIPSLASAPGLQTAALTKILPTVDPATHTAQIRLSLPSTLIGLSPGMFARVWMPASAKTQTAKVSVRLYIPTSTVVRRAEMTGVYVVDEKGKPVLRQVRLGQVQGERVEVLSGVSKGERIASDPQAAAKVR